MPATVWGVPPLWQAGRASSASAHRQEPKSAPRAVRLRGLRPRPVADRRLPPGGAGRADRPDSLLETSRVIFVLATPTSENQALLSRELLELLAPDTVLVLVSRAHVVDFDALTELVLAGRFRAAIDVYPTEPLAPRSSDPRRPRASSCRRTGPGLWRRRSGRSGGASSTISRRSPAGCRRGACRRPSPSSQPATSGRRQLVQRVQSRRRSAPRRSPSDALASSARTTPASSSSRRSGSIRSSGTGTRPSSRSASPRVDPERARTEVRSLLRGQWADGMVPHMVFHPQPVDYRPGPELWDSRECEGAPDVATSGFTRRPVLATAVRVLHEAAPDRAFLEEVVPTLEAWHRWFHRERRVDGLVRSSTRGSRPTTRRASTRRCAARRRRRRADADATTVSSDRRDERPTDARLPALPRARRVAARARLPSGRSIDAPFAYLDLPLNSILAVAEDDLASLWSEIGGDGARAGGRAAPQPRARCGTRTRAPTASATSTRRGRHRHVADLFPLYAGVPSGTRAGSTTSTCSRRSASVRRRTRRGL